MTRTAEVTFTPSFAGDSINAINSEDVVKATFVRILKAVSLTTGTGDDQCDRGWRVKERALDNASENIDIFDFAGFDIGGGDGNDMLGLDLTLAEIAAWMIVLHEGSVGDLQIGGLGATTAWNSLFGTPADDNALLVLPQPSSTQPTIIMGICSGDPAWPVADVTNHLLKIEAMTGLCSYSVYLAGRSG